MHPHILLDVQQAPSGICCIGFVAMAAADINSQSLIQNHSNVGCHEKLRSHRLFLTGTRQPLGKTLIQTRLREHSVDKDELLNSFELATVWSTCPHKVYLRWIALYRRFQIFDNFVVH
jgi:hypothetical protein